MGPNPLSQMRGFPKVIALYYVLPAVVGALIALSSQYGIVLSCATAAIPALALVVPPLIDEIFEHLKSLCRKFEFLFVPWILLFVSGLVFRTRDKLAIQDDPLDSWALFRVAGVGLAFLIIFSLYIWGQRPAGSLYRGLPGIFLCWSALGVLSTAWAVSPAWTFYKAFEYGIDVSVMATIIVGIKNGADAKRFFDWTWTLLFALLMSVWVGALIWPDLALESAPGLLGVQLIGVMPSVAANGVGEVAAVLCVVSLVRTIYAERKLCYGLAFLLCCTTLVFSQTRSALAGLAGAIVSILIARRRFGAAVVLVGLAALWLASDSSGVFWKYLRRGQDQEELRNLSGRTDWWKIAIEKFAERPALGYGAYSGGRFIVSSEFAPTADISTVHNDYLEVALGTGLAGLAIVVTGIIAVGVRLWSASNEPVYSAVQNAMNIEAVAVFTLVVIRSMFSVPLFWHPPLPFLLVIGYAEVLGRTRRPVAAIRRRRASVSSWAAVLPAAGPD